MTNRDEFIHNECEKIAPSCISAYFDLKLGDIDPQNLTLDHSWGETTVDLGPAVKATETVTHMKLSPDTLPLYLEYNNEDNEHECIYGEELGGIIPMTSLKDVDKEDEIADGEVYMYGAAAGLFKPFDLQDFVDTTNERLSGLEADVAAIQSQITSMQATINQILQIIAKPSGIPQDARIAWGNRNIIADYTNTNQVSHGIFTHSTSNTLADDQYFS